eukprot:TRINITY_DN1665_c0_g2_i21.p1 TRINITY_DN1665_c0_g2~~TRINITY_DN1665_c0_g2_i21.p1  ORF type:complete len:225 (-),score=46.36 TRINITY_DN1665_c0_g2_i21:160-834(-)
MDSGNYVPYSEMKSEAFKFNVPVVSLYKPTRKIDNLEGILQEIKENDHLEGCVLRFEAGDMYKIKTNWYHTLGPDVHRYTKTRHNNEKFIWSQILTHKYDDAKTYIGDKQGWMDRFADDLLKNVEALGERVADNVRSLHAQSQNETTGLDRQKFNQLLRERETDTHLHSLYWDCLNGKDLHECICQFLLRLLKTNFGLATRLAGDIRFADYKPVQLKEGSDEEE